MANVPSLPTQAAIDLAAGFARQSLSDATKRAYAGDWEHFIQWCRLSHFQPLPAEPHTVAAYLASMAKAYSRSTIRRRLLGIGQVHRMKGQEFIASHPVIRATLHGMFRQHGAPARKAAAIGTAEIRRLVATCDSGLTGTRDRALLLIGFAGALRRSELVGIWREHVTFTHEGIRLLIPRAKGDQTGEGVEVGVPKGNKPETCPVRAIERWLRVSHCEYGPVFRKVNLWGGIEHDGMHPNSVGMILRRRAKMAGLTTGASERLSSHGLRAGFVTEAYKAGARDEAIMGHTRHRDLATMRGYIRRAKLLSENPAKLIGL